MEDKLDQALDEFQSFARELEGYHSGDTKNLVLTKEVSRLTNRVNKKKRDCLLQTGARRVYTRAGNFTKFCLTTGRSFLQPRKSNS